MARAPERRRAGADQGGAGHGGEDRAEVVAGGAVEQRGAKAVGHAGDDRQGAEDQQERAAGARAQPRHSDGAGNHDRRGDQAAEQVVGSRRAGLGMDERVVEEVQAHERGGRRCEPRLAHRAGEELGHDSDATTARGTRRPQRPRLGVRSLPPMVDGPGRPCRQPAAPPASCSRRGRSSAAGRIGAPGFKAVEDARGARVVALRRRPAARW